MKTNENSIIKLTKKKTEFFLSKKMKWKASDVELSDEEVSRYLSIQNLRRKNEFLGVRYLKNKYDSKLKIKYLKNGKPVIGNESKYISISHSKNYVAFAVAPHNIGIDIEEIHDRILKVKNRFLNESELELFDQNSTSDLTIVWCVKEALFKLNRDSGINFKTDLIITGWDKNSTIFASMRENSEWVKVNLFVKTINNLVICFNFE